MSGAAEAATPPCHWTNLPSLRVIGAVAARQRQVRLMQRRSRRSWPRWYRASVSAAAGPTLTLHTNILLRLLTRQGEGGAPGMCVTCLCQQSKWQGQGQR